MPPMPPGMNMGQMPMFMPPMAGMMPPPMPPNMPPMLPPASVFSAASATSAVPTSGAFQLADGVTEAHLNQPINTHKGHGGKPPSKLAGHHEWGDEDVVPLRAAAGSVSYEEAEVPQGPYGTMGEDEEGKSYSDSDEDSDSDEEKKSESEFSDTSSYQDRGGRGPKSSKNSFTPTTSLLSKSANSKFVGGYERTLLLKSHLQKPKISIQKLRRYLRWVNLLKVWPKKLELHSVHIDLCNGLFLCRLMAKLVPGTEFKNLHKRPLSRKPAVANIEQALSVIWRGGRVNNTRVPSALDIYSGQTEKISVLLAEVFEVYVMKTLRKEATRSMMMWYNIVLKQYRRDLPLDAMNANVEIEFDGIHSEVESVRAGFGQLCNSFSNGVSLFCVLFHFCGPSLANGVPIDPSTIYRHPRSLAEYRANVTALFKIFTALKIDLLWTVDEWINFADTDFYLLQLFRVYCKFVDARCALPPATDGVAGITADRNGEPVVVNLLFADDDPETFRTRRGRGNEVDGAILVGDGTGQTIVAPPVCKDGATIAPHLPAGLVFDARYENPRSTVEELRARDAREIEGDEGILVKKDDRRGSFFKLSASSHFVMARTRGEGMSARPNVYMEPYEDFVDQNENGGVENEYGNGNGNGVGVHTTQGMPESSSSSSRGKNAMQVVEDMVRNLNENKLEMDEEIASKEKELEQGYVDLELQEKVLTDKQYDNKLDDLEERRFTLETEKDEIEEAYEKELAVIKATPNKMSIDAARVEREREVELERENSNSNSNSSPKSRKSPSKKEREADDERKRGMETGWIKQTGNSNATHNVSMKKKQRESEAQLAKTMTRKNGQAFSPFKNEKEEEQHVKEFKAFASGLMERQGEYLWKKGAGVKSRIEELKRSRPSKLKGVGDGGNGSGNGNGIGNGNGNGKDLDDIMQTVRTEELRLMHLEEERRCGVLLKDVMWKEKKLQALLNADGGDGVEEESIVEKEGEEEEQQQQQQQQQPNSSINEDAAKMKLEKDAREAREMKIMEMSMEQERVRKIEEEQMLKQHFMSKSSESGVLERLQAQSVMQQQLQNDDNVGEQNQDDSVNMDDFGWLTTSRELKIKERNSERKFEFKVVMGGEVCPNDAQRNNSYCFVWGTGGGVSGFVSTVDIADIKQSQSDPGIFTIALRPRNPQAVCNSGGLQIICVRCNSFQECSAYKSGLASLL